MKLAVASDIHLDHLDSKKLLEFAETILNDSDAVVLLGDISVAKRLRHDLLVCAAASFPKLLFCVLGNHDFYGSSVKDVRAEMKLLAEYAPNLVYLTGAYTHAQLSEETALVGHDGWYDLYYGSPQPNFIMADWTWIAEFADYKNVGVMQRNQSIDLKGIKTVARCLASEAVNVVETQIKSALKANFKKIVVATHVPPFEQAAVYKGKQSNPQSIPYFTSQLMGEMINAYADVNYDAEFTVLAGHTHGGYNGRIAKNIRCIVQECDYGKPHVEYMEID